MQQRQLAGFSVSAIGLGCMNLNHGYGTPPSPQQGRDLLLKALDLGVTLFDTAALYGYGANETLVGDTLSPYRSQFMLTSKCGLFHENGKRTIDGRPDTIRRTCEDSLKRLRTDVIDLYYLHRWDKKVPIEDSVGALADLVTQGKIRSIGLSEVSATTLRKAHAVHPIAAVQTEYSLWTRNPEIAVLDTCKELGTTFVAFSPLGRGFLGDKIHDVSGLEENDFRRTMPRFSPEAYPANLRLLTDYRQIAAQVGCTPAQLALAWLLAKDDTLIPIPGTTKIQHLADNMAAVSLQLSDDIMQRLDTLINHNTVTGGRYTASSQAEVDTEQF